ncbi:MAG: ABC transporter permease [Deltaproteobacteria bacterium]|nr:ABC transporter permease [Deltaproteobacteria bacterium]MBW2015990.1 ABC transporter permease [Deltaproteobacteria bacterium]MBW2128944.1 ABC transporter permease [Deltaproteobacteria bacterium]MBW2303446.1 ABC transporter permease [Deltaproteobacteria bacterium]
MTRYILGRVLQMIPVLFGVILAVFSLTHILPGDPVLLMLDVQYTREEYDEMKSYLGLDKPIPVQFVQYLKGVLSGDLGRSIHSEEPVARMVLRRFPATFILSISALLISAVIAIPIGLFSALRRNTKVDYASMVGAQLGISMPIFWLGLMMILLFSLKLDLLPPGGRGEPPDLAHLILPALCLSTPFMAMTARLTRSCMLEVLRENYIVSARSRGFGESRIILKHALRNAMIPVVTNLGLQLSRMLGGALVTEVIFRWPGIGGLAYDSIMERDYPVVMGVVLLGAMVFILINLLVDISYSFLDPRIRYEKVRS